MKTVLIIWLFVIGFVLQINSQLSLLYPLGGEKLPNNGRHTIVWTNKADMRVSVYIDWYDQESNLLIENNNIYSHLLSEGTNSFVLSSPEGYPTGYKYKVRLVGTDAFGSTIVSSDYVSITSPAILTGWSNDRSTWLPGQNRTITIAWDGFDKNQSLQVFLESSSLDHYSYGYSITNVIINTDNGIYSFTMSYPDLVSTIDDSYSFLVLNEKSQIISRFKNSDIAIFAPKLNFQRNAETGEMLIEVTCKSQASYTLQSSEDLSLWIDEFATNSSINSFNFSLPIKDRNKFFRVREN